MKADNELIAKFMGYEIGLVGYVGTKSETKFQKKYKELFDRIGIESVGKYWVNPETEHVIELEYDPLDYDSNWSSLMPVVEKIESLGYRFSIDCSRVQIFQGHVNWRGTLNLEDSGGTKIQATYQKSVEFIKWYNTNSVSPQ